MDKLERYRSVIERELTAIVEQTKLAISAPPGLRDKTVFDRQSDDVFDAAEADGADLPLVGFVDDPDKIYAGF
jgi:hypothetical protein